MFDYIPEFLASKPLSENSIKSYTYDLKQFLEMIDGDISEIKLKLYESSLHEFKLSAHKRKISAANQFLYFLYEKDYIQRFYRLKIIRTTMLSEQERKVDGLTSLPKPSSEYWEGYVIANLILKLGLMPMEIAYLKWSDIDLEFRVLNITSGDRRRILSLDEELVNLLNIEHQTVYIFEHDGNPYSRQWHFQRLRTYFENNELEGWTGQKLRQQFVLNQIASGKTAHEIAKQLGLKSAITLEKYFI